MALVDVEGPVKPKPKLPAAPPVLTDPAVPAFDEGYAYSTFSPAMGNNSSSAGPRGGTIDWSYGTDPNGYRPVYRVDGSMYWFRPEDGAVWEATPASRAGDQAIAAINRGGGVQIPVTNAPVIRGQAPKGRMPTAPTGGSTVPLYQEMPSYTLPGGAASIPQGGLPTDTKWVAPNPEGQSTQEREGHYAFNTPLPSSGYSDWGFARDLTTSALPESVIKPLGAGLAGPVGLLPGGVGDFAQDTGENIVRNVTSPVGAAGLLVGGPAANLAAEGAAGLTQTVTERAGLPAAVSIPAMIAAGGIAGVGAGLREGAEAGIRHSADDAADALARSRALNPARPGVAPPTIARQVDDILNPAPVAAPVAPIAPVAPRAPVTPPPAAVTPDVPPVAPRTRAVPAGGVIANTKKPADVAMDVTVTRKGPRGVVLEAKVTVDGADAGIISRNASGEQFSAQVRNRGNGALMPVPANAAGDPFLGSKTAAQNAVANAYKDGGAVAKDVPVVPRAKAPVTAAEGAATPPPSSVAPSAPVSQMDELMATPPQTELEAALRASWLNAQVGTNVRIQDPVEHALPKNLARIKDTGELVRVNVDLDDPKNGMVGIYDVKNGRKIGKTAVARSSLEPVDTTGTPIGELATKDIINELQARRPDLVPKADRQFVHSRPEGHVDVQARRPMYEQMLERARAEDGASLANRAPTEGEQAAAEVAAAAQAMSDPSLPVAQGRAAAGTATDAEVVALEALETKAREAIGPYKFDESFPPGYDPPAGMARLLGDEDAAKHWEEATRRHNAELKAEQAKSRVSRVKSRVGRVAVEGANAPRTLKANLDLSFVRRQGGALNWGIWLITNPKQAASFWKREAGAMYNALRRPATARAVQEEILSKPRPGLYIAPLDNAGPLTILEEANLGSFLTKGKYNPLRWSSNANVVFLNKQRAEFYDLVEANWLASKRKPSAKELDFLANFVNHATGRGTAEWMNNVFPALSVAMFSPRYVLSRFQLLADPFLAPTWRTRWLATRVAGANLGMQAATAVAVGTLLSRFGFDYEMDWRSSDFGRVTKPTRFGTAMWDTTAGLNQPIRFITQLATGDYKSATGIKERPRWETIARFGRSKMSPIGGEAMDWFFKQIPGLEDLAYDNKEGGIGSLPGMPAWVDDVANMIAPITIENAVRYARLAGDPASALIAASLISGEIFGDSGDFRGLSPYDERDQKIAADPELVKFKKAGVDEVRGYDDLNAAGQLRARQKYPVEAMTTAAKQRQDQKATALAERDEKLQGVADILRNSLDPAYGGQHQYSEANPGKDARDAVKVIQKEYAAQLDLIYGNFESVPTVVTEWSRIVDENTWPDGQRVDWDAVEAWESTLTPEEREELDQFFEVSRQGKTGIIKEIADASAAIGDSGFWDTDVTAWQAVKDSGQFPETDLYGDYYEFRRQWVSEYAQTNGVSKDQAVKEFDKLPAVKAYDSEKEKAVLQWVLDNPEVAKTADHWDYYTPNDTTRGFLATGDPTEIITKQQETAATETVNNAVVTTSAGTSKYADVSRTAFQSYAATLPPVGGKPASSFDSAGAYEDAGGTVPDEYNESGSISAADYAENPDIYIRVSTTTAKGNPSYKYISPAGKAEVEAIASLWKSNPDAVRQAFALGIKGFRTGEGGNLSATEVTWLRSQGVEVPE